MRRGSHFSITARLSLAFAAVSAVVFSAAGIYLYRALDRQLMQRHVDELTAKVEYVRDVLSQLSSAKDIANASQRLADTFAGHPQLHLRLLGADGRALFASDSVQVPAELLDDPAAATDAPATFRQWRSPSSESYLTIAALGRVGSVSTQPLLISLALEIGEEHEHLLLQLRTSLMLAMAGGTLLAMLLGWLVASRGLRPVRRIADSAASITANRLDRRLDERHVPEELAQLVFAFNAMLARLEESFRHLDDFSSDLAHELRTPITNLMGTAQVALARARTPDEYARLLESHVEEYNRLSRMISDMLFLARADKRQVALKREEVDLRAEVDKVLEFYEALLADRGLRISLRGTASVSADRILLQRAITNLVSNAVRHTQGGETIGVVVSQETGGGTSLEVNNPGPGIPAEHLSRIFDRFYRIDRAREHSQESSGLGLAIVNSIMRLHGGTVTVSSEPGDLTRFRLRFP
ncbi:MAG: heavy metal sensor histidine kinase [Betaproteobacteria bacterium]|nr:heavy metal sensor histidine kinase [Betaproteobacteria bacterium]